VTDPLEQLQRGLAERYAVERELGRGGMAIVFLARDLKHDRPVAIKMLRPELGAALGVERFLREIRLSAQLRHPHILPLYDSGAVSPEPVKGEAAPDLLYYVMPFVEGETLRGRLSREIQLPLDEALQVGREVAEALGYAHSRDVVHRDIKPENILLESGHALVADFGIARAITAAGERLTETGLAIGTPAYMSPEQASGEQRLDGRSDLYSLGCVMYEMLAGEPPYTGPTAQAITARQMMDPVPPLRTVRETVPVPVEQAINRALARVPADRFATAAQFVEALSGTDTLSRRETSRPRAARRTLRRAALVALAVALVAVGGLMVARAWRSPVIPQASMIAVLPFAPTIPDTSLARIGSDLMMTVGATLDGVGGVRAVDRYGILSAAEPGTSYAREPDKAAALARRFAAGSFVAGTIAREEAGVRLNLGIYRTDSHAPLGPVIVVHASADSLFALTDSITLALLHQIWLAGTPPTIFLNDVTTKSVAALHDFLDGERAAAAGRWPEAGDDFLRAAKADTTFWVASWRYFESLGWQGREGDDDPRMMAYSAHLSSFEPRDRAIIEAENSASREAFELHLARFKKLAEEYPNDWVASFAYADHLVHFAPLAGHSKAEARTALERTVALNPGLTNAWDHLLAMSLGQDSSDTRMALEGWTHLGGLKDASAGDGYDESLLYRLALQLSRGGRPEGPLLDSLVRIIAASDSVVGRLVGAYALLGYGYPKAQYELDQAVLKRAPRARWASASALSVAYCWAARGAWDSALVAMDRYAASYPDRALARGLPVETYELAVVGAWVGELDLQRAAARRGAAAQYVNALPVGRGVTSQAKLAWADGVLALLRVDHTALAQASETLRQSHAPGARFLDSSLTALGHDRHGATRSGADALAILDASFTDSDTVPRDPFTIAVDHLAAAKALLAVGDSGRASRELAWHEADGRVTGLIGRALAAPAYLELAEIEEGQGHKDLARFHYQQFLRRYDTPSPSHQHLVDDARAAMQRLGE